MELIVIYPLATLYRLGFDGRSFVDDGYNVIFCYCFESAFDIMLIIKP